VVGTGTTGTGEAVRSVAMTGVGVASAGSVVVVAVCKGSPPLGFTGRNEPGRAVEAALVLWEGGIGAPATGREDVVGGLQTGVIGATIGAAKGGGW